MSAAPGFKFFVGSRVRLDTGERFHGTEVKVLDIFEDGRLAIVELDDGRTMSALTIDFEEIR